MADRSNAERTAPDAAASAGRRRILSRFTLRHRLLLLTAVALLPAFVIVVANSLSSRALRSAEVDTYAVKMTEVVQNEVVRGLTAAATMMIAMGRSEIVGHHDAATCQSYTDAIRRDLVTIMDIAVADEAGHVYCHSGSSSDQALDAGLADLKAAKPGQLVVGGYAQSAGGPALPIGLAQTGPDGKVEGYILLEVGMAELVDQVTAATKGLKDTRTTVTDRSGIVLLSLPAGGAQPGQAAPDYIQRFIHADSPGTTRMNNPQGVPQVIGYRPVSAGLPIATVFELPEGPVMAPIDQAVLINSLIALAGAGVAFLLAWVIGGVFIQRPVDLLHRAISARRSGNRLARTGLAADASEFGVIGGSVDDLFDDLDRREALQKQAEEQRDLYAREVQHRVKNLLAIIQVIARQTLARPDASPEVRTFESRIGSIIRVHTKSLAHEDLAGDVADLVRDSIAPFVGTAADRIDAAGPPVRLRSKAASALAMALHELATNAVKYGGLSTEEGRIEVRWALEDGRFQFSWLEKGGPPVTAPSQTGFGTVLISRVLQAETRGQVSTEFRPEGLAFDLTAAAADLVVGDPTTQA